jgi:hypothetical protein
MKLNNERKTVETTRIIQRGIFEGDSPPILLYFMGSMSHT